MSTITKEFTKEQLIEFATAILDVEKAMAANDLSGREARASAAIAEIALASLEAEPVISHVGSKNALDAIVAFIKSNRNPTLKVYNEVSERLFQDNCHGLSNHVIEYIKQIGEELEELRSTQDTAPPAPISVPDELADAVNGLLDAMDEYPESLVPINRDSAVVRQLRAAMLQGAEPVSNRDELTDGWVACSERMPREVLAALQNIARLRRNLNDFCGDKSVIAKCLIEAEEALLNAVNRHSTMLAEAPRQE